MSSIPGVLYNGNPHKSGSWLHFERAHGKAANWSFPDENTAVFTYPPVDGKPSTDNAKLIYRCAFVERTAAEEPVADSQTP